jgi:DNA mismatch repair protein MutS
MNRARTPMLTQYLALKEEVGDAILFYRMGDFYEMFFEDAETAAPICDLTLTSRNKNDPDPVPMAGVPWHSAEPHIAKLLRAGHKVAVCEQVANPDNKKLMDREIVEILTPGTALSDALLDADRNNYLSAVASRKGRWGLAVADLSTGEFFIIETDREGLFSELERLSPRELLLPRQMSSQRDVQLYLRDQTQRFHTFLEDWHFSPSRGRKTIQEHFGVLTLEPFGVDSLEIGLAAASALITYAKDQRRAPLAHLRPPRHLRAADTVLLDDSTLVNLDILQASSGGKQHSLINVLDRTQTPMGARAIRQALGRPLARLEQIQARHEAVATLLDCPNDLTQMRQLLSGIADMERILARIHCGQGKTRDLLRLRDSLKPVKPLIELGRRLNIHGHFPDANDLDPAESLQDELGRALILDQTVAAAGEVIRDGYDMELDRLRELALGGENWITALQERERKATGISTLKVRRNKVFGFYIEVTRAHQDRVPDHYDRKQTLVNAERFTTPELKEREEKILAAQEQLSQRQDEIVGHLTAKIVDETKRLQAIAAAIALWDLLAGFAERAREGRYIRPEMNDSDQIYIRDGRHPVVEQFLEGESFVPNDLDVNSQEKQIQIITGPNMAGKSTFLRQQGLLVLMAQAGSFIPAAEARIGITDRIFTRVGASDRISRGQSTFLVEMIETSRILHEATSRSLVLLDEIGRGTSTYDGLAIAWSVAEFLRSRPLQRPRTLFATHFHELTELARIYKGYHNLNVQVKEWQDQIIFVRRVTAGAADRSYGIHVAKLAGLPSEVLERAREILKQLEAHGPKDLLHLVDEITGNQGELPLFGVGKPERVSVGDGSKSTAGLVADKMPDEARLSEALNVLDLDQLSPRDALDWLYKWQRELNSEYETTDDS